MSAMTPVPTREPEVRSPDFWHPRWLNRMRDEFDELFDRMSRAFTPANSRNGNGWKWDLNVEDKEDAMVVRAEAPGFTPEEIDVQVGEDRLTIKACHKEEKKGKEGEEEFHRQECFESMTLPVGIHKDKVEAKYVNGVLTVMIPKTEKARARKVPVKNG